MTGEAGRFITVEGIEGGGKSTHIPAVGACLESMGLQVTLTREPGGTRLGEAIRGLLLDPDYQGMSADAELLLVFAARAEHLARVIRPALAAGRWVVSDRFTEATYAYQGGGRGISDERIARIESWVQGELRPDLTLVFDLPVALGLARARGRSAADRFEREEEAFFDAVRGAYLARARAMPHAYRVIDATRPKDVVRADVEAAVRGMWE